MTIKTAKDLLLDKKQDDKNFLIWRDIQVIWKRKLEINFKEEDSLISFDEIEGAKKNWLIDWKVIFENWEVKSFSWNWLLSMWCVLLFEDWDDFQIALFQREKDTKHDPLHFTMPAWRLDDTLTRWCFVELFEEIIFADDEKYFQLDKWMCEFSQYQKYLIEKLWLPPKEKEALVSKEVEIPWMFTVSMFLWDREVDHCKNLFLYIDEENKTLEFRKVFIAGKKDFKFIYDWDDYGRNMFLVSLNELKKWHLLWKCWKSPDYKLQDINSKEDILFTKTLKSFLDVELK